MGVTCGYCAIGSLTIATRPAMVMTNAITAEKIGRSMKKWESMNRLALSLRRVRGRSRIGGLWLGRRLDNLYRGTRREPHDAFGDNGLTGAKAMSDEPVIAVPGPHLHRPNLCLALLVDNDDKVSLRTLHHRLLRHDNRVGPRCAGHTRAYELPGP